ncbi:DUF4129 domain-containing protein [Chloroflexota bacterium]
MKLDWRQGFLYITVIGIEGCWLFAMMAMLNSQVLEGRLSVPGIMLLFPLAFIFNGLLQRRHWHRFIRSGINWLVWAAAMLLMVKAQLFAGLPLFNTEWLLAVPRSIAGVIYDFEPALFIMLGSGVLWWLGRRLAGRNADFAALVGEFQFGLFMLVVTFLSASALEIELSGQIYLVVAFFLFSLLGISIAHALEGTSWLSGLYQGHWSGLLLVSISLVFLAGFIITMIFTPDFLQLIVAAIKYVWGLVMQAIAFLINLLPEPGPGEAPPMPVPPPQTVEPEEFNFFRMPEALRRVFGAGWVTLFIGGILFAMWRVFSDILRWLHRRLRTPGAEYERMPGAFRADLFGFFRWLLHRLFGWRLPWAKESTGKISPEAASVRQIYRQYLRWAAAGGYPRQVWQTPNEYGGELAQLLPGSQADLDYLTNQYVTVRYGASMPAEADLHRLTQAWHRVKKNHLKLKREG